MKKSLLIVLVFLSAYSLNAQILLKSNEAASIDTHVIKVSPESSDKSIMSETIYIGKASNVYTILDVSQNQVHYNADLDAVTFVHRQNNADWPDAGGSGVVRYDISTDGGATWELDKLITPMMVDSNSTGGNDDGLHFNTPDGEVIVYGYRYPSGVLLTPSGAGMDGSYYVAIGPGISTGGAYSAWTHVLLASQKMDGSAAANEQVLQALNNEDSALYNIDYMGRSIVAGGDNVYGISTNWNADGAVNLTKYVFWKGSINDVSEEIDWEYTIVLPDFKYSDTGIPNVSGRINAAFNKDGSVGYMVIGGCLNDYDTELESPLVYKTTDNGGTWELQAELDIANTDVGIALNDIPYFRDFDLVVDANGDLHVFSEVMQYEDGLGTFLYEGFLVDFTLSNADNSWTELTVGTIENSDPGSFLSTPSFQDLYTHVQASISADEEKIFLCWLTSVDQEVNDLPDIYGRGIDIVNGTWTEVKNLTIDSDVESVAVYATMSPVCITGGDDFDYELPYVCIPDFTDELDETNFAYVKGIGFNESEFIAISVDDIERNLYSFNIFPNPAQDYSFIKFNMIIEAQVNISIYNTLGQKVALIEEANLNSGSHSYTLNTSTFNNGLYFIEVTVDGRSQSLRLVVK